MGSLTLGGLLRCGLVVAGAGLVAAPACTLLLESESVQCRTPEDCKKKGPLFDSYTCSNQGVCIPGSVVPPSEGGTQVEVCPSTEQCTAANGDRPSICRKAANSDGKCLNLVTDHCRLGADGAVPPTWQNENAIYMASFYGSGYGQADLNDMARWEATSIEWAIKDINENNLGLPTSAEKRPVVLLQCDSTPDAFRHAAETVGVMAAFVGNEKIAVDFHSAFGAAKGIFTLCPGCFSDIRSLMPKETNTALAYTLRPHYGFQVSRIAGIVDQLQTKIRNDLPISKIKVVNVINEFVGAKAFPTELEKEFDKTNPFPTPFNGVSLASNKTDGNYVQVTYLDTTKETKPLAEVLQPAVDKIATLQPHIVILSGLSEQVELLTQIESKWTGPNRPYYVLNAAGWGSKLVTALQANADNVRTRVIGVRASLRPKETGPEMNSFQTTYGERYPTTSAPPETYAWDGVFGVGAAIVGAGPQPEKKVTGATVEQGIRNMSDPDPSAEVISANDVRSWANKLVGGASSANVDGISSSLDWDKTKGAVPSTAAAYCVSSGGTLYAESTTGTFTCP